MVVMNPAESLLQVVCSDRLDTLMDPEGDADSDDQEECKQDEAELGC